MITKNTLTHYILKDYADLIKENERLKDEIERFKDMVQYLDKDNHNLTAEITKLKKFILEEAELLTIWRDDAFELEQIIDIESCAFGLGDCKKLLELGFTLEEMTNYIKERRELYKNKEK